METETSSQYAADRLGDTTVRRTIVFAVAVGLLCAAASAQSTATAPPTLEDLTTQAVNLDSALRRTRDAAARRHLLGALEKVKHQMGPYNSRGKRIKCQAMWHDTALVSLEKEVKRLSNRPAGSKPKALAADARLHTRRMAVACLKHGWRMPGGTPKYQVDVFGQYLANNIRVLDALFESLSDAETREAKADPPAGDRAAARAALEKARLGIDQMGEAAKQLEAMPHEAILQSSLAGVLGPFVQGLTAARDAQWVLREGAAANGETTAEGDATATDTAPPAEAPPMTEAETARIAAIRQVAAHLEGDDWTTISRYLERFAAAVEAGFAVVSARPQAREFLGQIEQAANLVRSLQTSKIITPEYLAVRQDGVVSALEAMQSPLTRAKGFANLKSVETEDQFRRRIEAAGLTDQTAAGLVQTCYVLAPELEASDVTTDVSLGAQARRTCRTLGLRLVRMRNWPPEGMSPKLAGCYKRQAAIFRQELEQAGLQLPDTPDEGLPLLASAVSRADDLALIVRAAGVLDVVKQYRPARALAVTAQLTRAAQDLVLDYAAPAPQRLTLSGLVGPFEDLAVFPIAAPEYRRLLNRLGGRAYAAATGVLSRELSAGIDAASTGNPVPLRRALGARHLFGLVRNRAMAEAAGLHRAGTANLLTFSVPEKVWKPFTEELDKRLRIMLADYARTGHRVAWLATAAHWHSVYTSVVAGQRQTIDARLEGESGLDFLIRNLQRVAVPNPPTERYYAWRIGYHATEAAVTMNAGLDAPAEWHRDQMDGYDGYLAKVELDPDRAAGGEAK